MAEGKIWMVEGKEMDDGRKTSGYKIYVAQQEAMDHARLFTIEKWF